MIKGPTRTPYEDGLFLFDIQLPNIYPAVPPLFRYLSQCSGRLNPNLYDNGKVCVSLLGTWIGKVSPATPPPASSGFKHCFLLLCSCHCNLCVPNTKVSAGQDRLKYSCSFVAETAVET